MLDQTMAGGLAFLFPAHDTAVGRSLRDHGEFSRIELDFLLDHAGDAGSFVDVGANVGSIALPFAQQRPRWSVFAIEAQRRIAGLLAANAINNRLWNVEVIHAAAGPAPGLTQFPSPSLHERVNYGAIGADEICKTETVRLAPLDELTGGGAQLIKIDVEGYEAEVLKGATGTLEARRTVWVVEASRNLERAARVATMLQGYGYRLFWLYVPHVTPNAPKGPPATPAVGDGNYVALPPGAENRWRLPPVTAADQPRPGAASDYPYLSRYGY